MTLYLLSRTLPAGQILVEDVFVTGQSLRLVQCGSVDQLRAVVRHEQVHGIPGHRAA